MSPPHLGGTEQCPGGSSAAITSGMVLCGYPGIQLEPVFINLAVELIVVILEWRSFTPMRDVGGQRLIQEYGSRPQFKPDANLDLLRSSG
ncbi:MAG: hypothetical protein IPL59_00550 [Candidatus Competibacteraceae bacterium]|nr:hypothetical protein [Candidatus Competibacteraceae bacterium]